MTQRTLSRPSLSGLVFALLCAALPIAALSQTAVPDGSGHLVFRANAHTVVVDVVVLGKNGQPATGLRKEDFEVLEDGHAQKITYFEPHTSQTALMNLPDLPPGVFTNIPRVTPTDSVTVLLLDSLNSQLEDQSFVRAQVMKYLRALKPGKRVAIFTLGNQLRFIQGFTDDPALLVAALNNTKNASSPQQSALMKSGAETAAENQPVATLAAAAGAQPSAALTRALNNLKQFQAEQAAAQKDVRVSMTLDAFQELAHYLAGIPGRKNVIWFSSAFPMMLFPEPGLNDEFATQRTFDEKVQKTDALMAAAQVAIYPLAAEGVATDSLYGAAPRSGSVATNQQDVTPIAGVPQGQRPETVAGVPRGQMALQEENASLQGDSLERNANHTAMDEIARDTGGEAIYNTNDLNDAIARVGNHGANFYTITYTPTNTAEDGLFRKIQVKVAKTSGGARLAYRRGYFADKASVMNAAAEKPAGDPLHPFMGPGMPASTQIPFAVRVLAGPAVPVAASAPGQPVRAAGDNPDLEKLPGPDMRYSVDFVIAARGLNLDPAQEIAHHGLIEFTVVVYSQEGRPLNWLVREVNLDMDAARYAKVQEDGVSFRVAIDVPRSGTFLRSGIYDKLSNLAGTLEVPLNSVQGSPLANQASR